MVLVANCVLMLVLVVIGMTQLKIKTVEKEKNYRYKEVECTNRSLYKCGRCMKRCKYQKIARVIEKYDRDVG